MIILYDISLLILFNKISCILSVFGFLEAGREKETEGEREWGGGLKIYECPLIFHIHDNYSKRFYKSDSF